MRDQCAIRRDQCAINARSGAINARSKRDQCAIRRNQARSKMRDQCAINARSIRDQARSMRDQCAINARSMRGFKYFVIAPDRACAVGSRSAVIDHPPIFRATNYIFIANMYYLHYIGTQCVGILQIRDIHIAKYTNTRLFESRKFYTS